MSKRTNNKLRKNAGIFWIISLILIFVFVYIVSNLVIRICGVTSGISGTIAMDISSIATIAMYMVTAIWGLRNL